MIKKQTEVAHNNEIVDTIIVETFFNAVAIMLKVLMLVKDIVFEN